VDRSCLEEPKRINKSGDGTKSVWKTQNKTGGLSQKEFGISIVGDTN